MKYATHYLKTSAAFIEAYDGSLPFATYLKKQFSAQTKYGSKDRKAISSLCYYHFRLGHGETVLDIEQRILLGVFLCEHEHSTLLDVLKPEWNNIIGLPLQEKLLHVSSFYHSNIFPWANELSEGIEAATFSLSFLVQPKLFIRTRPGRTQSVISKLTAANIPFEQPGTNTLALPNATRLDDVLEVNKDYVVQDYNSQRVGEFLNVIDKKPSLAVWDCCAGSGGKSIMAYDINNCINLTVTDVRSSILNNLKGRFKEAGINKYEAIVADLRNRKSLSSDIGDRKFDVIICDAPCTGSGTWNRTPENLFYFNPADIGRYGALQKEIVKNIIPFLKPEGFLLYVTCSAFKRENEEVVGLMETNSNLLLQKTELLKGYGMQADTMFAALFRFVPDVENERTGFA